MCSSRKKYTAFLAISLTLRAALVQAQATTAPADTAPPLTPEQIQQLVAPIALYPDDLLAQVLMASTYPLEIVQADRWAKANAKLTGDALGTALDKQPWDASVKSLVNTPQVLSMMSEKLDDTVKLGDAVIADQKSVLDAVQVLRGKAQAQGNLKTTPEQKVEVVTVPGPTTTQVIQIAPANPEVIYVPTYNPTVVYGSWPYPAYPPYYWHPPGYVAAGVIGFGAGLALGAAWGNAWGNCNWGGGDININNSRNNNFNTNIDRSNNRVNANNNRGGAGGGNSFKHDPAHRGGVAYRDQKTSDRVGASNNKAAQSRDAFRGRTDSGGLGGGAGAGGARPNTGAVGGAGAARPGTGGGGAGAAARPSGGAGAAARPGGGAGAAARPSGGAGAAGRPSGGGAAARPAARPSGNAGALSGVSGGGRAASSASQRGNASRSASPSRAARPSSGSRGGGGGGRRR